MNHNDVQQAVADLVAVGVIPDGTPPHEVEDLVVRYPRDLTGLEAMSGLQTLRLIGASVDDYALVGALPNVRVLAVEHSTLEALDGVLPAGTRVAVVRRNRLRSLEPLLACAELQVVDASGNPLDDAATGVLDELQGRGLVVTRDDDEVRRLNQRLLRDHEGLACYGTAESCTLTATGLELSESPDRVAVATTAATVAAAIGDDDAVARLLATQWGS